jgi:hypothetical protein
VRLLFAAMLALLSMQTAMPLVDFTAACEGTCRNVADQNQAEQKRPRGARRDRPDTRPRRESSIYISLLLSEPDIALLFQLPPPVFPLVS